MEIRSELHKTAAGKEDKTISPVNIVRAPVPITKRIEQEQQENKQRRQIKKKRPPGSTNKIDEYA